MIERRKGPRVPIHLTLSICDLYKQDVSGIHYLDSPIEVTDISEYGIGFSSECILPVGYYINASITYEGDRTCTATLRIIRCDIIDETHYFYGGEFVSPKDPLLAGIMEHISAHSEP